MTMHNSSRETKNGSCRHHMIYTIQSLAMVAVVGTLTLGWQQLPPSTTNGDNSNRRKLQFFDVGQPVELACFFATHLPRTRGCLGPRILYKTMTGCCCCSSSQDQDQSFDTQKDSRCLRKVCSVHRAINGLVGTFRNFASAHPSSA